MYSLRCRLPHGTSSIARLNDEGAADSLTDRAREVGVGRRTVRELDADRERRLLLDARRGGPHEDVAADAGANALTTSRTADGKTLTPRTISMSSVRPMQRTRGPVRPHGHGLVRTCDVIARAEAQQRRSPVPEVREHELARGAVARAGRAAPVSGSISSAWTKPRAPRCMPSCSSHSPHSDAPMSPMPIASVTRAPQPSSSRARKAGSPPPGSPATSTRTTLDPAQVEPRSAAHSIR